MQVCAAVSTSAPPAAPASTDEPPTPPSEAPRDTPPLDPVFMHLAQRFATVKKHFPTALSAGDFLSRTEMALANCGFQGHNSIAVTNFCRDEATALLKDKIDSIFGSSFNINGLGAGITCGCLGAPPTSLSAPVHACPLPCPAVLHMAAVDAAVRYWVRLKRWPRGHMGTAESMPLLAAPGLGPDASEVVSTCIA